MKNIGFIGSTFYVLAAFSLQANPSSKDAKEIHDLSKKICAKMSECVKKETAKLPKEQRQMMESMFPSGNICESRYASAVTGSDDRTSGKVSKDDIAAMKRCAEDMSKMNCEKLMQGDSPKSCERFQDQ
jgi:hypothetical protein